jgi:DNA-binding CsgD family transcriptional regulator
MVNLFNNSSDRSWLLSRIKHCVLKQPLLLIGFTAYWLWVNMVFQAPILFPLIQLETGLHFPARLAPIACAFLTYLILSIWFKKTNSVIRQRWYISVLAMLMIIGSLLTLAWLNSTAQSTDGGAMLSFLASENNYAISLTLYLLASLFIGSATACLCIEFQRVFGTLGTQYVLYLGCLAVILSCILLIPFTFLPQEALYAVFVLDPLFIAFCLQKTIRKVQTKSYFTHGLSAKLIVPGKLLATSALHGISIGVLMGISSLLGTQSATVLHGLMAFIGGAVLLLLLSIFLKMDYNHLLYQVGFPLVALGALFIICFSDSLSIGVTLQLGGFSFIHLVMWGVCTYFIANLKLPATWTIGVSTCAFMFGQLLGAILSIAMNQAENSMLASHNLEAIVLFLTLFASLLMMSSTNLRTGWGLARLAFGKDSGGEDDRTVKSIAEEFSLSERQANILLLLTHGRSRRFISKELFISEETVKTHMQQLYRKAQVHNRQELIDLYENRREALENDDPRPLFSPMGESD